MSLRLALVVAAAAALMSDPALAQSTKLVSESLQVPSRAAGIQLHVRNTRPAAMATFTPDRVVLFVHGVTYPAETTFDLKIDGQSWMDYIAERGYDVWMMDVRGYGRSTRPAAMERPAKESPPVVNTAEAIEDFGAVVDHVLQRRGLQRLTIMGWSWGTVIAGAYASRNAPKVDRVVLYAPLWLRREQGPLTFGGGAYREVTADAARARWMSGVPADTQKDLIPPGVFEAWWSANMEADPFGAKRTPPVVRAPSGALAEGMKYWEAETRYYDPSGIRAPVLLIVGEWDADTPPYMAQALMTRLVNAPRKRLVIVGEATHTMLLERNRMQLFREVQNFLDER